MGLFLLRKRFMNLAKYVSKNDDVLLVDSFVKADSLINSERHQQIMCSISGGSDSDIMLDLCHKVDREKKISYVWFDTGLEYQATKDHLEYLEWRYRIQVERRRALMPIPLCCKTYGQPFLSKYVSDQIRRLQAVDFSWEDRSFEELSLRYPSCTSALKWWCDYYDRDGQGKPSRFSISRNKHLKRFLMDCPPWFSISNKCCYYAKKKVSEQYVKEHRIDLSILGVRKYEGGIRSVAYDGCYTPRTSKGISVYRPLFWYRNDTKAAYQEKFHITHSLCYTAYGMSRTGCAGCPYNRHILQELEIIEQFEPRLFQAVSSVFSDSYEYTRLYRQYAAFQDAKLPLAA